MIDYLAEHSHVELRVGARTISLGEAREYVATYLRRHAAEPKSEKPFAYPAYDGYPGAAGLDLGAQDLLAPDLLNVALHGLRTYYDLIAALPVLNERLRFVPAYLPLADADGYVLNRVGGLYGVLDGPEAPFGARMTTLAKIVHRKRPQLLPLWDDHIARCYLHEYGNQGPRIEPKKDRSWRDFVAGWWLPAVQEDLRARREAWEALARLTPSGYPTITPLRALDIVGWHLGSRSE